MILWNSQSLLHLLWSFNEGCNQTGLHVPFDMAMEKPDAWVVGSESKNHVSTGSNKNGVTAHWLSWHIHWDRVIVKTRVLIGTVDKLEVVAV